MAFTKKDRESTSEKIKSMINRGYHAAYNEQRFNSVVDLKAAMAAAIDESFKHPGYYEKWLEVAGINRDGVDIRGYARLRVPLDKDRTYIVSFSSTSLMMPDMPWSMRELSASPSNPMYGTAAMELMAEAKAARHERDQLTWFVKSLLEDDKAGTSIRTLNQFARMFPQLCTLLGGEFQRALKAGTGRTKMPENLTDEHYRMAAKVQEAAAFGALWSQDMLSEMGASVEVQ